MDKAELATYLVNLHTLMQAQTASSHALASSVLAKEYEKHWGLLKETITNEEKDDEGN